MLADFSELLPRPLGLLWWANPVRRSRFSSSVAVPSSLTLFPPGFQSFHVGTTRGQQTESAALEDLCKHPWVPLSSECTGWVWSWGQSVQCSNQLDEACLIFSLAVILAGLIITAH